MKYAWIARHKKYWPVSLACYVPGVNKRVSSKALAGHIRAVHAEVKQVYGWPKMCKELAARGIRVGKERVRRTMKENGIKARGKRKFVVITDSKHTMRCAWHGSGVRQMKAWSFTPTGEVDTAATNSSQHWRTTR